MPCPYCHYSRFWKLRRNHARCKKCKREWSRQSWLVPHLRISENKWRLVLDSFLRDGTGTAVARETNIGINQAYQLLKATRELMFGDQPSNLKGPLEIDDAFLGPRWHNRRKWQRTGKRGRGTDQQPILGVFDSKTKKVIATVAPHVKWKHIHRFLKERAPKSRIIYTDTYTAYHLADRHGYRHKTVDHQSYEYARGRITVNHIESFWGYIKRRFKVIGGIRKKYINLYLAEWVWRYNHRQWSREAKVNKLIKLLKDKYISGRT